jgi:hypothetical protein
LKLGLALRSDQQGEARRRDQRSGRRLIIGELERPAGLERLLGGESCLRGDVLEHTAARRSRTARRASE